MQEATIIKTFPQYTLHDETHLLNVLEIMVLLFPKQKLKNLSPLELASLILVTALHDVGMALSKEKEDILLIEPPGEEKISSERKKYQNFKEGYPKILTRQKELIKQECIHEAQEIEKYLLSQYIRQNHGIRAHNYILKKYHENEKFLYNNYPFAPQIAKICQSHTEEPKFLEQLSCYELVGPHGEYVNWRFIAVMLRLADILDFDAKRTPKILFEHLGIREKISLQEWGKHRSIKGWDIKPGRIAFSAKCPDPIIEKCIRDFIKTMDLELSSARGVLGGMHDPHCQDMQTRYKLDLPTEIDTRDVGPKTGSDGKPIYIYVDTSFQLDHESIMSMVMGINLYGNKLLFLRELLQNAVDACDHAKAMFDADPNPPKYEPEIRVELYQENGDWYLAVEDNGMGMNEEIIKKYFAKIGKSYYKSTEFLQEKAEKKLDFYPISTFGIGILSVFMVTDTLKVETRKRKGIYELDKPLNIEIQGPNGLFWFKESSREDAGTRIIINLKGNVSFLKNLPKTYEDLRDILDSSEKKEKTLKDIVLRLAPHINTSTFVYEGIKKDLLEKEWIYPESGLLRYERVFSRQIEINLTEEAPKGLNGIVWISLLQNEEGSFTTLLDISKNYNIKSDNEDILHQMRQRFGYIDEIYFKSDEKEPYEMMYSSIGRWSQNGFCVPQPYFEDFEFYGKNRAILAIIFFPFVIYYDLDVSGDFQVNLTIDRLRIIPDEKFEKVKNNICEFLSKQLLSKLGKNEVIKSELFFREIIAQEPERIESKIFEDCLNQFLKE